MLGEASSGSHRPGARVPESPRRTGEATVTRGAVRPPESRPRPHGWRTALQQRRLAQPRESAHRKPCRNEREERGGGREAGSKDKAQAEPGLAEGLAAEAPAEKHVRKRAGRGTRRCQGGRGPAREDAAQPGELTLRQTPNTSLSIAVFYTELYSKGVSNTGFKKHKCTPSITQDALASKMRLLFL